MESTGIARGLGRQAPERTLIVVDADPAIVRLVASHLVRSGFTVLTAGSAVDAIALAEAHAGKIDLLLTEVMLQAMSGVELTAYLKRRRAGIRVIYMCSYLPSEVQEEVEESGKVILNMPFSLKTLADKIRAA